MVGVSMGVNQVVNPQTVTCRQGKISIDETDFRINEHSRAALRATDQVRLAAPGTEMFEDHRVPRARARALYLQVECTTPPHSAVWPPLQGRIQPRGGRDGPEP